MDSSDSSCTNGWSFVNQDDVKEESGGIVVLLSDMYQMEYSGNA
jgi:hypothetical protein